MPPVVVILLKILIHPKKSVYHSLFSQPEILRLRAQSLAQQRFVRSIQYFPDLFALISRLRALLRVGGEVHILDSPLYAAPEKSAAAARSASYYDVHGVPEMNAFYHHHALEDLREIPYRVLHSPDRLTTRLRVRLGRAPLSPFPWVMIPATEGPST